MIKHGILRFIVTFNVFTCFILHSESFPEFFDAVISQDSEILFCDPDIQIAEYIPSIENTKRPQGIKSSTPKEWTIIVYMAADNDLRFFATNNIKQMTEHGSNHRFNLIVHLDIRVTGNQKLSRRYYVEKGRLVHVKSSPDLNKMDSGDPQTLISSFALAVEHFPAQHYGLILWNHGTGIIDPKVGRTFNPSKLFQFNPVRNKLELDRSIGVLDLLNSKRTRGICWDHTTGNYLTNQKFSYALKEISTNILQGKKIDLLGFDACLMSMAEIASMTRPYAHYMVGSQEAELGWGWNYASVISPFSTQSLTPGELAAHIVRVYQQAYQSITDDYTQSAINLNLMTLLEENIDTVAKLLLRGFDIQLRNSLYHAVKISVHKQYCVHFDEPRYKDLYDFYNNLQKQIPNIAVDKSHQQLLTDLYNALDTGKQIINQVAFAYTSGPNLARAKGISIYFPDYPDRHVHDSYIQTAFAQATAWPRFISRYLHLRVTQG